MLKISEGMRANDMPEGYQALVIFFQHL